MTPREQSLIRVMAYMQADRNAQAIVLQRFIAENGPLSEEAGAKVRKLLGSKEAADDAGRSDDDHI